MDPFHRIYQALHQERIRSNSPQQTAENLLREGLFCEGYELYKQLGDAIEMQEIRTGAPQLPPPPVGYTG